jgi:transglutaminase-like putative cysteine protease
MDLAFAVAPGLTLILVLATFTPVIHPKQIQDAVWEVLEGPWAAVDQASQRMFGPIIQSGPGEAGGGGLLPQAHLLGGRPELGQEVVMYVWTDDPPPPPPAGAAPEVVGTFVPRRYWRSTTFDTYTGDGWSNGPLEARAKRRGEALAPAGAAGAGLLQTYELNTAGETLLYAVNAPLHLDLPAQSWWRSPGDLVELTGDASRYTAVSRPPAPSREALRTAPPTLPPEISERYLALPDTVPERVLKLAREVTGDSETHFDQALAIETFLRAYTYTLEVPLPPANRDLVDYFLFDLQQGYCDYYASAMVVMARAVGIPARLATGYAQGRYNYERGQWEVREEDGHSY